MTPGKVANKVLFQPKAVPVGQRARRGAPKKKHKAKPQVGRGEYVKAPLLRDKVTQPRWLANAVVNNPGSAAATTAIGTGVGLKLGEKKISKADRKKDAAAGGLIGGGAAHLARQQADYGAKATAERQFKPLTNKGNYGPYKDTEHKPVLNKYKREAQKAGGADVRSKAKYFDENFPKGVPSYKARKVGVMLNKKPVVAATIAAGAGAGALANRKVKKSASVSAFGVDHG